MPRRLTRRRSRALDVLAASAAVIVTACAAPNLSRTVGQGNGELHASVGGPMFQNLGAAIPIPNANLGGRVGATDWLDVDANANLLAAAYGVWAADLAAVFQLYRRPRGLAVSASTRVWTLGDLDDPPAFRAYPELGLHLGGTIPRARWLHPYGGATTLFNPRPPPGKPAVFATPFFGTEFLIRQRFRIGKPRQHGIAIHVAYTNPSADSTSVVEYWPGRGALSVLLGYRLRFGGLDR